MSNLKLVKDKWHFEECKIGLINSKFQVSDCTCGDLKELAKQINKEKYAHNRPDRRRIGLDVPTALFDAVKAVCAKRNITMTKYILRLILEQINKEK